MSSLVNTKFAEWTCDLDTRESMISIFGHIRDIPYSLGMPTYGFMTAAESLLASGRGSCGPKHHLLAEMYRKLNLNVIFATFDFSWNDPDIRYPNALRNIAARLPVSHHLACRVQIGCRWVLMDATWDPSLEKAGFPVNREWDGYSDTQCAVRPVPSAVRTAYCRTATNEPCRSKEEASLCPLDEEKDHWNAESRAAYYAKKISLLTPEERNLTSVFYRELDAWMEILRQESSPW